jgi:hypothetical protein
MFRQLVALILLSVSPALAQGTLDSLRLELARLEIDRAAARVSSTGLWHRLIPKLQVGATFGVRELVFPDLSGALILPKDSYRLSVSYALADLIDGTQNEAAEFQYREAILKYHLLEESLARARLSAVEELGLLQDELLIARALEIFHTMEFEEGKGEYPALAKARLEVMRLEKAIREKGGIRFTPETAADDHRRP